MRYYSSTAPEKTLSSSMTNTATTMVLSDLTGLPTSYPYTLVVDPDVADEEIVLVTSLSAGTTLNVTRGTDTYQGVTGGDGTSKKAHNAGAKVRHMVTARDLQEPQNHINATSGVHGVAGDLVGTTSTQTLTNKTISSSNNTITVGISNVTNLQTSLDAKAPLASPVLTGNPTVAYDPAINISNDSATIATTAWVQDIAVTKVNEPTGNGFVVRTASGTVANRSLTQGSGITITNADGVSGNPTIALTTLPQTGTASISYSSGTGQANVTTATTTASSKIFVTSTASNLHAAVTSVGTNTFTISIKTVDGATSSGTINVNWLVL